MPADFYQQLGGFSDWVGFANRQHALWPSAQPGAATQEQIRALMGFTNGDDQPIDVQIDQRWERDGIAGEAISWSVGYGPRTEAWLLKPAGVEGPLPGILALHDHGGFKFYGKEKIADGRYDPPACLQSFRQRYYAGRAYTNELAKAGFAVLVFDTFLWGSRRFPLDVMPAEVQALAKLQTANWPSPELPEEIALYHAAAGHHEHYVAKYCNLLGTSLAGVVCYEDRVAANYLLSRDDILADRVGCIGLSGGGNRAAMLRATHDQITAAVIIGLMSTYEGLLDRNVGHTWMLYPFGLSRIGDWPDLAACRAPQPLLVQYDREDELFTAAGMQAAHQRITDRYESVGATHAYTGQFYPGPHKFDLEMQHAAYAWLQQQLH
ncbi:MAG: alpha/beta hydrolase family protein [Roseiflexaceae bacterium]